MPDRLIGITDQASGAGVAEMRARERTISTNTVEEQYVIPMSARVKVGTYRALAGPFSIAAAAHAATAGFMWLVNTSTSVVVALRRVELTPYPTAATAFPSGPRVTLERVTFTGTPTGAAITPAKVRRTSQNGEVADAANVASVRTASTGLTLTAGEGIKAFVIPPILTAVGAAQPVEQTHAPDEDGQIVLANGEGIVIRQADAGTTSDTRKHTLDLAWDEYTLP